MKPRGFLRLQPMKWMLCIALALEVTAVNTGCGGGSAAPPPAPVPSIVSISPASATAGQAAFTLTVNGSNFVSGATVQWNRSARATTFVSSTQVTAAISASDLFAPGFASVSVLNPGPSGLGSATTNFKIDPANPAATISSLSPTNILAGGPAFTLTVNGANFVSGAVVQWKGSDRPTSFLSSTQLTAAITASDIATSATIQILVLNPFAFPSSGAPFTVFSPVPVLSSISPTSAVAGDPSFTLTVNGMNFVTGARLQWNTGNDQPTMFVSSMQLRFSVPPDLIACATYCYSNPGAIPITISNPSPGGGISNALPFTLNNPSPQISALSQSKAEAGAAPIMLGVTGAKFIAGAVVRWNGSDRATTFGSDKQLSATILASDLSAAGAAQVTVVNPAPSSGPSMPSVFTIDPLTSNPTPAISSLSDMSAPAGWPGFSLTVGGSGFVAATTTQWNGLNRSTSVLSSSLLKTNIPASDLANGGAAQVSVFNPSPGGGNSNSISFEVKSVPAGAVGVIERSSVASDLTEANAYSDAAAIGADGRFIAFSSYASNLVSGDSNGTRDIFLRDTCRGMPTSCTPSVNRVSVASDGSEANGSSFSPAISANGRFIAFASDATNLVPGDTNGALDVFVRDTCVGASNPCNPSTTRASLDDSGGQLSLDNFAPSISSDGRYVAFASGFPGDDYYYGPNFEIYVRDMCTGISSGCTQHTIQASVHTVPGPATVEEDGNLMLNASGRFVAFTSDATDLVSGDTNGFTDVFLHDTCIGGPTGCEPSTVRVSVASGNTQSNGSSNLSSLSGDGRFVAFISNATNLVPGIGSGRNVFVRDTCIGVPLSSGCVPSTTLVSVATDGSAGNDVSGGGSLSANGRFIVFDSYATNLVPGDTNNAPDIFLRDTCIGVTSGCTPSTIRISIALDATQALGPNAGSYGAVLSADGRFAAFLSGASNLGPGDTNGQTDVFLARTNVP